MAATFSTSDLISQIRRRQENHPELKRSHHFVFDCPLDRTYSGKPDYIWFGVNPGTDTEDWQRFGSNSEETRDFDFQAEHGRSKASTTRINALRVFLGDEVFHRTTHCELFFWCSSNTGKAFKKRYGYTFEDNPHWDFCCEINRKLIERVRPKAVMAESRNKLLLYETRLGLQPGQTHRNVAGDVLVEQRWLNGGIPFYCFDHLSALGVYIRRRPEVSVKIAELLSLDPLIGTWTHEEALEVDHALRDLSRIDRAMWE